MESLYSRRLARVRENMSRWGADILVLNFGPDFIYLTGMEGPLYYTTLKGYGDWVTSVIVSQDHDPQYEEAVRLVLQMGKASTSTLQRHLRLGYGRAARILDIMQRDGIIGPPDGSKPREVLKRPDWLRDVEDQLR